MENEFFIRIHTHQKVNDETQELQMVTTGTLRGTQEDYEICYTETDGDLRGAKNLLHVENKRCVTVQREGDFESHMIIEKNVRHISQYITPYGTFMLGVNAIDVTSDVDETGGTLHFSYNTDIDMVPLGTIKFEITLTKHAEAEQ